MIRGQKTEDRGQNLVCRHAAYPQNLRGRDETYPQSSILCVAVTAQAVGTARPTPCGCDPRSSKGFTLVEMIMVIVITGIIGGMVAMFIRAPMQGYVDSARRAEMTDIADTALRRMSRDLRLALPNSVRVSPSGTYLEFIPTTGGGRYRTALPGDPLNFAAADPSFDVLGPAVTMQVGDQVVVYNLGIPGADAYAGTSRRAYAGGAATTNNIGLNLAGGPFPFESPGNRFQVVATPVTYVCAPVAGGGGTLTRYWGYALQAAQPVNAAAAPLVGAASAVLATHVGLVVGAGGCSFSYNPNVVAQRTGVLTMQLTLTDNNESITLHNATHVSNEP